MCAVRLNDFNPHLGHKEDVVRSSVPLVISTARRFAWAVGKCGIDMDDLISEAWVGLLKAFERFDPSRFTAVKQFSTYAVPLMQYQILGFLRDRAVSIKAPASIYQIAGRILKGGLTEATDEQTAQQLGCTAEAIRKAKRYLHDEQAIYLDKPLPDREGEERSGYDLLPSDQDMSVVHVQEFVSSLDGDERKLLECQVQGMALVDIATKLNIHIDEALERLQSIRERCKSYFNLSGNEVGTMTLTKEKYLELKAQGMSDEKISSAYKISNSVIYRRKKQWAIPMSRGGDRKTLRMHTNLQPHPAQEDSNIGDPPVPVSSVKRLQERLEQVEHENGLLRALLKNYL